MSDFGSPPDAASTNAQEVDRSVIHTSAGLFKVDGSTQETLRRLAAEEWPMFTLSDSRDPVFIRSAEVTAVQQVRSQRGRLGFRA